MDKLQAYRQPMVTATGIILGFILGFSPQWTTTAFSNNSSNDYIIAIVLLISIPILLIVLYRSLNIDYPKDKAESYYRKSLFLFVAAVSLIFLGIFIIMIQTFILRMM